MAGLEARSSEWAPAEFPLHAFSLSGASEDDAACGAKELAWLRSLTDVWSRAAAGARVERDADPARVAVYSKRQLDVVERDLLALWKGSAASQRAVLRCAVVPLECSARVWQVFGGAAGRRDRHLFLRLRESLIEADREIRAGERALLVNRSTVSFAARAARGAIDDLLGALVDPADGLAAVEDAAVDLASFAVRIALNVEEIGGRRPRASQPTGLGRQLEALACEVSSAARASRSARESDAAGDHVGAWLSVTLRVVARGEAIELSGSGSGDPCERADALCSLRARWLELAVGLWAIVQTLDEMLILGTFSEQERLKSVVSSRAGSTLVASGLCMRPGEFDHHRAWKRQHGALLELVGAVCVALQTREPDAVLRGQQLALRRLARALAAIWTIDERLRSPLAQASRPCP